MKLLVITQAVDKNDPVLGFFHRWLIELAKRVDSLVVICLYKGEHTLPSNVRVYSLGKEEGKGRITYLIRLYRYVWSLRREYNAVFVHMNQEYVLVVGVLWKVLGKRTYLWRNHYAGNWLTDIAATFCTKIFCTSRHSYTARFRKTILMPVGVDASQIAEADSLNRRIPRSILFLSRISPSKRPELFLNALHILKEKKIDFSASVYGSPTKGGEHYYEKLKTRAQELGLEDDVSFHAGIPNRETSSVYASHDIFVNTSLSGMFDKTLFEAAQNGCLVTAVSDDFAQELGDKRCTFTDATSLANSLETLISISPNERILLEGKLMTLAKRHGLEHLMDAVVRENVPMHSRRIFKNKGELIQEHITPTDTVLDVGFWGQGIQQDDLRWPHKLLKEVAREVYGVDLAIDRKSFPDTARYYEGSAEQFSIPRKFDVIFAGDLIEHLSNHGGFLSSVATHLSEKGRVIITTPNAFSLFNIAEKFTKDEPTVNSDHTCYFNHKVLSTLLTKNGFKVEEIAYVYSLEYSHKESVKKKSLNVINRILSWFTPKFSETLVVIARPI